MSGVFKELRTYLTLKVLPVFRILTAALLIIILLAAGHPAAAGDLIGGRLTLEGKTGVSSSQPELTANLRLELERYSLANGFHVDVDLRSNLRELSQSELELHEAYYDHYGDSYDLRLGRQLFPWGTALKFNPTDILNPPQPENPLGEKQAVLMAAGNYYLSGGHRLTGVIIPYHRPVRESVTLPGGTELTAEPAVGNFLAGGELAVKLSGRGISGYDYSISLFRGYEDAPVVRMKATPLGPRPEAFFRDYLVLGADLATSISGIGFWAEGAGYFPAEDREYYSLVLGADYKLASDLYLEGQVIYLQDQWYYEDTLLQGAVEKPLAGIHNTRLSVMVNPDQRAYLLIPEIEISLADAATLTLQYKYRSGQVFSNPARDILPGGNGAVLSLNYSF